MKRRFIPTLLAVALTAGLLGALSNPPAAQAALPPIQLALGVTSSCALEPNGQTYCWGANDGGELGNGTTTDSLTPVTVNQGGISYTSIVAGTGQRCGLAASGLAYCWGVNDNGEVGNGTNTNVLTPAAVSQGAVRFASLSAVAYSMCGLTSAGQAYCWGLNANGQLGNNTTTDSNTPVAVTQGGVTFASIATGGYHVCGLTSGGATYCWGANWSGQLGDNTTTDHHTPTATVSAPSLKSITAENQATCGITSAGAAYCWGANWQGAIGDGTTTNRYTATAVSGGITFASLSGGLAQTCGLTGGGVAYCWGRNGNGQLGNANTSDQSTPAAVTGGITWSSLVTSVNSAHTCAVKASSQNVYCWGDRMNGRLGDVAGEYLWQSSPVKPQNSYTFSQTITANTNTCGLSGGQVYCWGINWNGEIGDGTGNDRLPPTAVSQGGQTYAQLTMGADNACGLTAAGQAYCWGNNGSGQLGNGTTSTSNTPVAVTQGGVTFASIAAGGYSTCGLTSGGQAYCWGSGSSGQMGNNAVLDAHTPTAVTQGGVTFASIAVGGFGACGLTSGGQAYCWGANWSGQIGDSSVTQRNVPTAVSQSSLVFGSISMGYGTTCAATTSHVAYCWGWNSLGQVGNGTNTDQNSPVAVTGATSVASLAVGTKSTCDITLAGVGYCWGGGAYGELGTGNTSDAWTPAAIAGAQTWSKIQMSSLTGGACGTNTSNVTYCWGYDDYNELGDWVGSDATSPQVVELTVNVQALAVSANISAALSFNVSAHTGACDGVAQTAGTNTTATAVNLGHLTSAANSVGAQDLEVATNAPSGFTLYLRSTAPFASASHTFTSVSGTNASPGAFPSIGTEAVGYTTSESTLGTGTTNRFTNGGAKWAAFTTSNAEISFYPSPIDHTICFAAQAGTASTTPAGAYSTSVIYTAIANF